MSYPEAWEMGSPAACGQDSKSLSSNLGQYADRPPTMRRGDTAIPWSWIRKRGVQHWELSVTGVETVPASRLALIPTSSAAAQPSECPDSQSPLGSLGVLPGPVDSSPTKHNLTPYRLRPFSPLKGPGPTLYLPSFQGPPLTSLPSGDPS